MTTLVSTNIPSQTLIGSWPQVMTIVQEFDHPVVVTDDFKAIFYTKSNNASVLGQMASKPIQYVPTQLSYTMQVSPFGQGMVGLYNTVGTIEDIYGNAVDLRIGDDFDLYNTEIRPYYTNPYIRDSGWTQGSPLIVPPSAICPGSTAPQVALDFGPYPISVAIPDDMWSGGNFFLWVNYTWKPNRESEGIPFVWEPPFYYSFSSFGFPYTQSKGLLLPPFPVPSPSILSNITSSGAASQGNWDTCGWIDLYPRWNGKVQIWLFGNDVFQPGVVPWQYPAVASPTGDLSPYSIFGFPQDAQLQVYKEIPFAYIAP